MPRVAAVLLALALAGAPASTLARGPAPETITRLLLDASGVRPAPCELPAGWTVAEPFTDHTPYWPAFARFLPARGRDEAGTRRILLRSPLAAETQVFLLVGETAQWAPRLDAAFADLAEASRRRYRIGDAAPSGGLTLEYVIARPGPTTAGVTHLLGAVPMGARTLVVDAGGTSARFDPEVVLACLRTLRLREPAA